MSFTVQGLALARDTALGAEFICCPGRGPGNSTQQVTEVTGRGIWLWDCYVRWEKVEISALNQTCYKSTGGVQGEGGLVHWLPVPPVPGLPPHQASVAGTTVLPGGRVLLGQGQVSRWLVSAFQGCTVPWRARQGRSRAITVPRSCRLSALAITQGCPWIWHIPAAAPQQSVRTLCPSSLAGQRCCLGFPGWAESLVYSLSLKQ